MTCGKEKLSSGARVLSPILTSLLLAGFPCYHLSEPVLLHSRPRSLGRRAAASAVELRGSRGTCIMSRPPPRSSKVADDSADVFFFSLRKAKALLVTVSRAAPPSTELDGVIFFSDASASRPSPRRVVIASSHLPTALYDRR